MSMPSNLQLARTLSFGDDEGISDAEILAAAEEEFAPRGPLERLTDYDRAVLLAAIEIVRKRKRWTVSVLADEMGYTTETLCRWRTRKKTRYRTAAHIWHLLELIYAK